MESVELRCVSLNINTASEMFGVDINRSRFVYMLVHVL